MTDNEIIKMLEICTGDTTGCGGCPLNDPPSDCTILDRAVLDLIKRQRAEIAKAKSEAITEFAERLKEKYGVLDVVVTLDDTDIDNLVEEMVGENGT